jgi:hypothetical protein
MDGYQVEPQQLRTAANGIGDTIAAADDMKLEDIGKGADFGHAKLATAVKSFGTTWELAKQLLQERSAEAGQALMDDATVYEQAEARGQTTFDPAAPQPTPMPGPVPTPTFGQQPAPGVTPTPTATPGPTPTPAPTPGAP